MLILLPPSEGKTDPGRGKPLELTSMSLPSLTPARERVLDALVALCRDQPDHAATVLGLSLRGGNVATDTILLITVAFLNLAL